MPRTQRREKAPKAQKPAQAEEASAGASGLHADASAFGAAALAGDAGKPGGDGDAGGAAAPGLTSPQGNSSSAHTPPSEDRQGGAGDSGAGPAEIGTSADWATLLDAGKEAAARTYPNLLAAFEAGEPPFSALRIEARADRGFRRAGLFHSAETVEHGLDTLTPAQVEQLLAEPMLKVELI